MLVYLLQDVRGKGKKGDILEVSEGYGRNYLIPQKLAVLATEKIKLEKSMKDASREYHAQQEKSKAQEAAKFLEGKQITIRLRSGANDKLFGSVTSKEVADLIKSSFDVNVDKKNLNLPEIKQFGTFNFSVKLYGGVVANMKVCVEKE